MDLLQKQVDELRSDFRNYMSNVLGALFTVIVGIIALIGFILWDLDLPYKVDLISYKDIKDKNLKEEIDKFGVEIDLKKLIYKSPALFNASSISGFLYAKSFKTFSILSLLSSNSFVFLATGDRAVLLSHSINPIRVGSMQAHG